MTDRAFPGSDPQDLDAAEAQSERIRSDLAGTVGELRRRLSPTTIRHDVTDRVVHSGRDRVAQVRRLAADHPLQAAALGIGAAYPVFGILRRIPAPFLLIGAGVAMAGRNLAGPSGYGAAGSTSDRASGGATERVNAMASNAVRSASDAATNLSDRMSALGTGTANTAAGLANAASDAVGESYDGAVRAASAAGDRLAATGRHTQRSLLEAAERNPFVAAGLVALAGAAVAAMLPSSRTEARLFGETSDSLKRQAKASVDDGIGAVMGAGSHVLDETLQAAGEEGLGPDAARQAVRDVAEKAGAVIDKAFAAAAPEEPGDAKQPSDTPNSN